MAGQGMTTDQRIVSDILFGDQTRRFQGGGDKIGAALSNFINARENARQRALRNQEFPKWQGNNNTNLPSPQQSGEALQEYSQSKIQQNQPIIGANANSGRVIADANGYHPQGRVIADPGGYYGVQPPINQEGIGANENGVYGIDTTPKIGADVNGVYGVTPATTSNRRYTFNESDYLPQESNGYHLDSPENQYYGHPEDWQRQMVRNNLRDVYEGTDWYKLPYNNFGSAIAKAEQPQKEVDRYPQELVGLTGEDLQRAGQAYNQRIDGGNYNFGKVMQNAERAVAPQIAPTAQPITQYTPPPNNSPSVADFKRYNDSDSYNTPSVADFKRNEGGYNTPVNEPQYANTLSESDDHDLQNLAINNVNPQRSLNWLKRKEMEEPKTYSINVNRIFNALKPEHDPYSNFLKNRK